MEKACACCLVAANQSGANDLADSRTSSTGRVAITLRHVFFASSSLASPASSCTYYRLLSLSLTWTGCSLVHALDHVNTLWSDSPVLPRPFLGRVKKPLSACVIVVQHSDAAVCTRSSSIRPLHGCSSAHLYPSIRCSTHRQAADATFVEPRCGQRNDRVFIAMLGLASICMHDEKLKGCCPPVGIVTAQQWMRRGGFLSVVC